MMPVGIDHIGPMPIDTFNLRLEEMAFKIAAAIRDAIYLERNTVCDTPRQAVARLIRDEAQSLFAELAKRMLPPGIGFLTSDDRFCRASTLADPTVVVTIEPVDGMDALERILEIEHPINPEEISVTLGVQIDDIAVAAYVCEVIRPTLYKLSPYSSNLWRIMGETGTWTNVDTLEAPDNLRTGTLLRSQSRSATNPLTRRLIDSVFHDVITPRGSIGLCAGRIMSNKHEVALLCYAGSPVAPWTHIPLVAWRSAGLALLRIAEAAFEEVVPTFNTSECPYDLLCLPRYYLPDLAEYGVIHMQDGTIR